MKENFIMFRNELKEAIYLCQSHVLSEKLIYLESSYEPLLRQIEQMTYDSYKEALDSISLDTIKKEKITQYFIKTGESVKTLCPQIASSDYKTYDRLLQFFSMTLDQLDRIILHLGKSAA